MLLLGEAHNAGGVENVALDVVSEATLQNLAALIEVAELLTGVVVLCRLVGNTEVREYRDGLYCILRAKQLHKLGQLLLDKAKAVHSGVELDVHGIVGDAIFFSLMDKHLASFDAEHLRLKPVGEHSLVIDHAGIEHHDRHRNSGFAQIHALVVNSHGKIGGSGVLECLGKLVGACPIARSLHHANYAARRSDA